MTHFIQKNDLFKHKKTLNQKMRYSYDSKTLG